MSQPPPGQYCRRCNVYGPPGHVCPYCGYDSGPTLQRFLGLDMTGMGSARRVANLVGFAVLILLVVGVLLRLA